MLDDLQFFRTARALRVSPLLVDAADRIDAAFPDELCRQLLPLLSRLTGTADDGRNEDRVLMAQDWLARTCLPVWLRAAELGDDASRLRGLAPLRDAEGRGRMVEIAKEVGTRVGLGAPCRAEGFRLFSLAAAAAGHAESGTSPWRHVESADPDFYRTVTRVARDAAMRVALAAIRQAGTGPNPGGAKPERPDGAASGGTVSGCTVSGCTPAERRNAAGREERDHVTRARARAALEPAVALLQRSAVELFTHMAEPPTREWPYEGRTPAG